MFKPLYSLQVLVALVHHRHMGYDPHKRVRSNRQPSSEPIQQKTLRGLVQNKRYLRLDHVRGSFRASRRLGSCLAQSFLERRVVGLDIALVDKGVGDCGRTRKRIVEGS